MSRVATEALLGDGDAHLRDGDRPLRALFDVVAPTTVVMRRHQGRRDPAGPRLARMDADELEAP